MPGYRVHDFLTVAAAAALAPAYWSLAPRPELSGACVVAGSCLISGLLFSPDLDLRSHPRRRWGVVGALWWPYQQAIPHRSWLSHGLIAGPLVRLVYFFGMVYGVLWGLLWAVNRWIEPVNQNRFMRRTGGELTHFWHRHPEWVTLALAGFVIGGVIHTLADVAGSALSRLHW